MIADSSKIVIRGLRIDMYIGILDHEKEAPQPIILDLEATLANWRPGAADAIESTVNYATLAQAVRDLAAREHINLLETFAEQIADLCLSDANLKDVRLRLEKRNIIPGVEAIGVEFFRTRGQ